MRVRLLLCVMCISQSSAACCYVPAILWHVRPEGKRRHLLRGVRVGVETERVVGRAESHRSQIGHCLRARAQNKSSPARRWAMQQQHEARSCLVLGRSSSLSSSQVHRKSSLHHSIATTFCCFAACWLLLLGSADSPAGFQCCAVSLFILLLLLGSADSPAALS